jgi:hypothetical protein
MIGAGTESPEVQARRLATAREELAARGRLRRGGRQQAIGVGLRGIGILAGGPLVVGHNRTNCIFSNTEKLFTAGRYFVSTPVENLDAANAYDTRRWASPTRPSTNCWTARPASTRW